MKRSLIIFGLLVPIFLGGCGSSSGIEGGDGSGGQPVSTESSDVANSPNDDGNNFNLNVPSGWVEIDQETLGTDWQKGYDNSASEPTVRLKYTDNFGNNSNVTYVSSELFGRAQFGGAYGEDLEVEKRDSDQTFEGSDESVVTVFTYTSGNGNPMRGCWWVIRNSETLEIAVVEVHGRQDAVTDKLLSEFQDSISFGGS